MPFDYNSFFQGVQTGLRLGRTSPGRRPPVPSGRYILTESGAVIVTENPVSTTASVYGSDLWYNCPASGSGTQQIVMFKAGPYGTYEENEANDAWYKFRFFIAYIRQGPSIQRACCLFLFSFDEEIPPYPGKVFQFYDNDYTSYKAWEIRSATFSEGNCHGSFIVDPYNFIPQPDGTPLGKSDYSDNLRYADAVDFAWRTQFDDHLPLITEGG